MKKRVWIFVTVFLGTLISMVNKPLYAASTYDAEITITEDTLEENCTHVLSDWEILTEPSCSEKGVIYRECDICEGYQEALIPENNEHDWDEWETSFLYNLKCGR